VKAYAFGNFKSAKRESVFHAKSYIYIFQKPKVFHRKKW